MRQSKALVCLSAAAALVVCCGRGTNAPVSSGPKPIATGSAPASAPLAASTEKPDDQEPSDIPYGAPECGYQVERMQPTLRVSGWVEAWQQLTREQYDATARPRPHLTSDADAKRQLNVDAECSDLCIAFTSFTRSFHVIVQQADGSIVIFASVFEGSGARCGNGGEGSVDRSARRVTFFEFSSEFGTHGNGCYPPCSWRLTEVVLSPSPERGAILVRTSGEALPDECSTAPNLQIMVKKRRVVIWRPDCLQRVDL